MKRYHYTSSSKGLASLWMINKGYNIMNPTITCILYFLTMFSLGGATGVILGSSSIVLSLHDTYYIISHFHIVLALGSLLGLFNGTILYNELQIGNQGCQSLNLILPTSTSMINCIWMYLSWYGISLSFLCLHYIGFTLLPRRINDYPDSLNWWNSLCSLGSGYNLLAFYIIKR